MFKVIEASYSGAHRIHLVFSNGASGVADLQGLLDGPIFEPLNDPAYFAQFRLTDHTIEWPNGADFAPEYLHSIATQDATSNAG